MGATDLLVRIESQFQDGGFKSAEASAKTLERELGKLEAAERAVATMQMQAAREDAARSQARLAAMEQVGRGATLMGAAMAAGYGLAAKSAMDWETAWTGVTKTVDGSADEMAQLQTQLRDMANVLPATHEEIAAVAEAAGQLGVKRADIASFTKTMIDLGETTNLSSDEAATGLAQLGNVMGVLPSQASKAGSALVALGNAGASTEADILAMSLRLAGAGKTIGLTEAQVMGFASALSSMGIEAEAGGSAFSRVFVDIAQAVDSGGDQLDEFARVAGRSTDSFATKFRTDAAGAVTEFVAGLGRIQASGGSVFGTLESLGLSEVRMRDALLRAANAGDLLRDSVELGSRAWEDNMALVEEAGKRYETSESKIAMARNQLNNAAIDVGSVVLPALAKVAEVGGNFAKAFSDLPEPVRATATVLGLLATALAVSGGAAAMAIPKYQALQASLMQMGPTAQAASKGLSATMGVLGGPWGIALMGATVLLGGFVQAQQNARRDADSLRESLDKQTGALTDNTRALVGRQLQDKGIYDTARKMGVAIEDVTAAALGQADAQERVNAAIAVYQASQDSSTWEDARIDIQRLSDATVGTAKTLEEQKAKTLELEAATKAAGGAAADATPKVDSYGNAVGTAGKKTGEAAAETMSLKAAQDLLAGNIGPLWEAENRYAEATDATTKAIEASQKAHLDKTKALDASTEAGRRNRDSLIQEAEAAKGTAEAALKHGDGVDSVKARMDAARATFIDHITQLIGDKDKAAALADQMGVTRGKVDELSTAIKQTPEGKAIKITADTAEALWKVQQLKDQLALIRDKTVTLTLIQQTKNAVAHGLDPNTATGGIRSFPGGMLSYASGGSFQGQVPRVAWNQGTRGVRWAETGAGAWEAWISGHPGRRQRSLAVWADVGRKLGAMQDTGRVGSSPSAAVAAAPSFPSTVILRVDGREFASYVDERATATLSSVGRAAVRRG